MTFSVSPEQRSFIKNKVQRIDKEIAAITSAVHRSKRTTLLNRLAKEHGFTSWSEINIKSKPSEFVEDELLYSHIFHQYDPTFLMSVFEGATVSDIAQAVHNVNHPNDKICGSNILDEKFKQAYLQSHTDAIHHLNDDDPHSQMGISSKLLPDVHVGDVLTFAHGKYHYTYTCTAIVLEPKEAFMAIFQGGVIVETDNGNLNTGGFRRLITSDNRRG